MLIGYARVSTKQQELALQLDALEKAGCEKIFGAKKNRPELKPALEFVREGDTRIVWKPPRNFGLLWQGSIGCRFERD